MIRITSIKRCHVCDYDDIYLIIRSTTSLERSRSSILQHSEHVPDLSPSKNLFYEYLNWQKTGNWNQAMFDKSYKPTFIDEINNNPDAIMWLDKIAADDASGKKIALLCFCPDENLCHRLIIADMLKQRGCNVILDCDTKRGIT